MDKEQFAIKLSITGSAFITLLGVGFAVLTRSEAILLDGLFNLITFALALLTLKVVSLINREKSLKFQFGYHNFEPLLNMIKGLIILVLCVFALVSSIKSFWNGGKELEMGLAVVYAIAATVSCFTVAFLLRQYKKQINSPLVEVETFNWMVNSFVSSGITLTFVIAFFMEGTAWKKYVSYVDPVLVCVLVLFVIKLPIQTILEGINQLLGSSPDSELEHKTRERITGLASEYSFEQSRIRMMLIGRLFYVLIQIQVPATSVTTQVCDLDKIRARFSEAIRGLHLEVDIDIVFTMDPQWIK